MRKMLTLPGLALVSLLTMGATTSAPEGENTPEPRPWNVDASHTEINFSVKHFFTPVSGTFKDFEIDLMFDAEAPENSSVNVSINVASVDTKNERRDNHLRSADFFDTETHPQMTFESTSIRMADDGTMVAKGNLTIKGITKEIDLGIDLLGITELPPEMQEMMGGVVRVAGFQASTTIDRREFEVGVANWAQTVIVGGDVNITIALEANHK
jgi:polyisoprenoid-binding protein YceI